MSSPWRLSTKVPAPRRSSRSSTRRTWVPSNDVPDSGMGTQYDRTGGGLRGAGRNARHEGRPVSGRPSRGAWLQRTPWGAAPAKATLGPALLETLPTLTAVIFFQLAVALFPKQLRLTVTGVAVVKTIWLLTFPQVPANAFERSTPVWSWATDGAMS